MTTTTTFDTVTLPATVEETAHNLRTLRNINAIIVDTREEALTALISLLPPGAEIFPNRSITLQEIGFVDYLEANPGLYRDLRASVIAETDPAVRMQLRRQTSVVDYVIGSVNAITTGGELVFASHGGSQLAGYAFTAARAVWVVGAQKIVPTLDDAMRRVREYAHPLEDQRLGRSDPSQRTRIGKTMIIEYEWFPDRSTVILVKEALGF